MPSSERPTAVLTRRPDGVQVTPRHLDPTRQGALLQRSHDQAAAPPCFATLNLISGDLRVDATDEFAVIPPWLVAGGLALRWPVATLPADGANALLDRLAPHAQRLLGRVIPPQPGMPAPVGVLFGEGAAVAVDLIQRICAATYDDPTRLR